MDSALVQMFVLLLTQLWTFSRSEPVEPPVLERVEILGPDRVDCKGPEVTRRFLMEGESLWYVPVHLDRPVSWFWNRSGALVLLSSEEAEPVHAHGNALCLLNITREHSGCFLAWVEDSEADSVHVSVVPEDSPKRFYPVTESDTKIFIDCLGHAKTTCADANGTLSWYKDGVLLPGENKDGVWVFNTNAEDEVRYDCVCTWIHQHHRYRTVSSRVLHLQNQSAYLPVRILAPTEHLQLADSGASLLLNCTVLCGTNVPPKHCQAWWTANNVDLSSEGYKKTTHVDINPSSRTIVTQTLTITRLSALHFGEQYTCSGRGRYGDFESITVHLQPRQSLVYLVAVGTCVFILFLLGAVMVKCFMVDLVLLSRRLLPAHLKDTEGKVFDAYVVYQMPSQDKPPEELVGVFVYQDLPHVLEDTCGYRLFIHGRDDLPGEDRVELVEERMRKSRRLMVILSPGVGSEVAEFEQPQGFDWQVGLHQALVLTDLRVILIQLGDPGPGGYSHLTPALQHLIQRSAPLRWSPGSRSAHSRFWKTVRYLMPATPVRMYRLTNV